MPKNPELKINNSNNSSRCNRDPDLQVPCEWKITMIAVVAVVLLGCA